MASGYVIQDGKNVINLEQPVIIFISQFYKLVDQKRDDLLDDAEDTAPVFDFFKGEQKTIFEKTLKYIAIFENSKTYVSNQDIIATKFQEIKKKLETSNEIAGVKNIRLESDTLKLRCLDEIEDYERKHQSASGPIPPTNPSGEDTIPTPVTPVSKPKQKARKNVSISKVTGARTYSLENETDIDNFLADMKKKLMNELETDIIITLS